MSSKTPMKDLIDGALKHYDEVSKEASNWRSIIPEAIKFYELSEHVTIDKHGSNLVLYFDPKKVTPIPRRFEE